VTETGLLVRILGPLHVETTNGPLTISAPKQRVLLAILALHRGHSVGMEVLIDSLWGDDPPRSANKTLQTYISGLRRLLPADTLRTVPGGYELNLAPEDFDVDIFERCLKSARLAREAGQGSTARDLLEEGLALWRGSALGDLATEIHGLSAAQRLDELRREALEDLHGVRMEAGNDSGLVADLEAAVSEEPLRERRWAQLMTVLYRNGRQADALRTYRRLQEHLDDELGIAPSAKVAQLERAILLQDPALSAVPDAGHGGGLSRVTSAATVPTLKQSEPVEVEFSLQDRHLTIGRQVGNDVVLNSDLRVSRHHAEIQERDGEWVLRDLRSRNGTTLNGERITEGFLRNGDKIKIGSAVFDFTVERDLMATMTGTRAPEG
jgi:DNA-binding SARP family transcriptional activator